MTPTCHVFQVLLYPMTQGLSLDLPSHHTNERYNPAMLGRRFTAEIVLGYIGENSDSEQMKNTTLLQI